MALLAGTAFVLDQGYAERVAGGLLPSLKFVPQGDQKLVTTIYETVDWRLWQAGWALLSEDGRLSLRSLSGHKPPLSLREPPAGLFAAASLAPGVLRRRLEGEIGDRGLLPIARIEIAAERYAHRNAAGKIDCRADLIQASVDGVKPIPALLVPQPLRGYEREAEPLLDAMARELAQAPAPAERLRIWLNAAGRRPDDSSPPGGKLKPGMPAGQGVAVCLRRALATIEDRAPLTIADLDKEDLHQFRVAVRQGRGLLKALGDVLPPKVESRGKKGLRWLGRLSTPVRDLDVLLAGEGRQFSQELQETLRARRAADHAALVEALQSDRYARFCAEWRKGLKRVSDGEPTLQEAADRALMQAATRFVGGAQALTEASVPEELHELRKHGKQLRYLLDFFRDLYPKKLVKGRIRELKIAQDALGEYQDLTAHQELLEQFEDAQALLASLAAQERAKRADAMTALGEFRLPDALDAYKRLTGIDEPAV